MEEIVRDYVEILEMEEMSPNSIKTYTDIVRFLWKFVHEHYPEADFTKDTVQGYMIQKWAVSLKDLKPTTKNLYFISAKKFLNFLYEGGRTKAELSRSIPKIPSINKYYEIHPDERSEKRAYTDEEVQAMLSATWRGEEMTLRNRLLIALLVSTGLRISEALSLNVGDVTNGTGFAMVARKRTHGNKVSVAIPTALIDSVENYLYYRAEKGEEIKEDTPLFTMAEKRGIRLDRRRALESISTVQKRLGLPTGLHTFRHTALSIIGKVADPITARDVAGQKRLEVTNIYLHTSDQDKLAATEAIATKFLGRHVI